jgi:hypothetical protein
MGRKNRRISVQVGLDKTRDPSGKLMNTKRARVMAQVIKCLLGRHKALSSNPSTAKKKISDISIHLKV